MGQSNIVLLSPLQQRAADVFGIVVHANGLGFRGLIRRVSFTAQQMRLTVIAGNHLTASGTDAFVPSHARKHILPGNNIHGWPFTLRRCPCAQTKAPGLAGVGQADQQVSDLFVLIAQMRSVAIAHLSDAKRPARQRDADPSIHPGNGGHLAPLTLSLNALQPTVRQWMAGILFGLTQNRKDPGARNVVIFMEISSGILLRKIYVRIPLILGRNTCAHDA